MRPDPLPGLLEQAREEARRRLDILEALDAQWRADEMRASIKGESIRIRFRMLFPPPLQTTDDS